jgi:hypothetical protein
MRHADGSQWRELPPTYRALVVRNRADLQWIAIEVQHERMTTTFRSPADLSERMSARHCRGLVDLDFFLTAVRRLERAANLARDSCDPAGELRQPVKLFRTRTHGVTRIRDTLEHFDDEDRRGRIDGLGVGTGPDSWTITYGDLHLDTAQLVTAARDVHRAIRAVVDPEAFKDAHSGHPMVELRSPESRQDGP